MRGFTASITAASLRIKRKPLYLPHILIYTST
jgi:hypothetical protein